MLTMAMTTATTAVDGASFFISRLLALPSQHINHLISLSLGLSLSICWYLAFVLSLSVVDGEHTSGSTRAADLFAYGRQKWPHRADAILDRRASRQYRREGPRGSAPTPASLIS